MTTSNRVEIPLSKGKITMILLSAIVFVVLGFWLVLHSPTIQRGIFSNPTLILVAGITSILFFGLCAFMIFNKLKDNKPRIITDSEGITDNASGILAGKIPWKDIADIKVSHILSQMFLLIVVPNPEEYINRQTNGIKRKVAEINYKNYGSPISISATTLKTNFEELQAILEQ